MGRQLLLNPERHRHIVNFIKGGSTIINACRAVGISQEAFFTWMRHGKAGKEEYVAFFRDVEEAKALATALNKPLSANLLIESLKPLARQAKKP